MPLVSAYVHLYDVYVYVYAFVRAYECYMRRVAWTYTPLQCKRKPPAPACSTFVPICEELQPKRGNLKNGPEDLPERALAREGWSEGALIFE